MNPEQMEEIDFDIESPAEEQAHTEEVQGDKFSEAENLAIKLVGRNIYDQDLENALHKVITEHFNSLREKPAYSSDTYQIIELNNKLWQGFHSYEEYIQNNKITNVDINELNRLLRETVLPKLNQELWDITSRQSQ